MDSSNEPLRQAIELLLDLPNVEVQAVHQDRNGSYIVTLVSTEHGTTCHIEALFNNRTRLNGNFSGIVYT